MTKVLDLYEKALSMRGWDYKTTTDEDRGTESIFFSVEWNDRLMFVEICDEPAEFRVMIRCRMADTLPEDMWMEPLMVANHINLMRWFTHISLDPRDNEIIFAYPLNYFGLKVTFKAAQHHLQSAIEGAPFETELLFDGIEKFTQMEKKFEAEHEADQVSDEEIDSDEEEDFEDEDDSDVEDIVVESRMVWSSPSSDN